VKAILVPALASVFICMVQSAAIRAENANEGTLRVCLNENLPPYSLRQGDRASGFDFLVAEHLAKRLGRPLAVQWFESKLDADSSPKIEANALLSDGRCALLGGYPLIKDALGKPGVEDGRLPDFAGARPADRRRRVSLGTLAATRPYHFAALTVLLGGKAAAKPIARLADLDGMRLAVEGGTLADAILMSFDGGRYVSQIKHFVPGHADLWPALERGDYDATLDIVHRFDAYRISHPDTAIKLSGFYLPVGFNMGFVALAGEGNLIERVNAALGAMLEDGEPASFARAAQMTYLQPRQPDVLDGITMSDLTKLQ
jgi:ABC-type amino acid transport substrate-binding protein